MKEKLKRFIIISIILIFLIIVSFICYINYMKNSDSTIGDIAYDRNRFVNNIVYLKENEKYVPYIVVTNNYSGNTLLLRKECLEKSMYISNNNSSYYENCLIDTYLNNDYLERFSESFKEKVVNTNIEIISKESIGICGTETTTITRKAFLLSLAELGVDTLYKEGKNLKYFNNIENRLANDSLKQNNVSYWLRTADAYTSSTTYVITGNNQITSTNSSDVWGGVEILYVRPALCIKSDTKIEGNQFIVKGREVYVVSE